MKDITESLATKMALLKLLSFSLIELKGKDTIDHLYESVWTGLYPGPAFYPDRSDSWVGSYVQTYIERGVR